VAKAGLVASLPARTSIIAAANPVGGHFDRGKTVQVGHGRAGWKETWNCRCINLILQGSQGPLGVWSPLGVVPCLVVLVV
jgi:hypothetical protein